MSSAVGPVLGASCAAWVRGGEGRSSQRREADAVAYMAATCGFKAPSAAQIFWEKSGTRCVLSRQKLPITRRVFQS